MFFETQSRNSLNVSPPGVVNPIGGKFRGVETLPIAKLCGPNSNALSLIH